jgi:acetolactate decarboxylase
MSVLWQNAPAISLQNGCFDGITTVAEAKKHGTLGVGAFDHLDGEMVMVDGVVYRMLADSGAEVAADTDTLAFCMVIPFEPEASRELPDSTTTGDIGDLVADLATTRNLFVAFRLHGTFGHLHTRSLPRQDPPYPMLEEVEDIQPEYHYTDVSGLMVGFSAPSYAGKIAPGGFHLHVVDDARTIGGHVIDFQDGRDLRIEIQCVVRHEVDYPATAAFARRDLV